MLQAILERTAAMVAAQLRSDAVVVTRLLELITSARDDGHAHRAIHAAITLGGLPITWNNYRSALQRARRAARAGRPAEPAIPMAKTPVASPAGPPAAPAELAAPLAEDAMNGNADDQVPLLTTSGPSNTVELMAALRRARQVSTSTDFARIAREQYRARERELKQKGMQ